MPSMKSVSEGKTKKHKHGDLSSKKRKRSSPPGSDSSSDSEEERSKAKKKDKVDKDDVKKVKKMVEKKRKKILKLAMALQDASGQLPAEKRAKLQAKLDSRIAKVASLEKMSGAPPQPGSEQTTPSEKAIKNPYDSVFLPVCVRVGDSGRC